MKIKLNLSSKAEDILKGINSGLGITPNVLCRYAIILAIKDDSPTEFNFDSKGLEFQRYTLTGEYDLLFRELIKSKEKKYISDDDYFTQYLKAYIEKGLKLLQSEIALAGSFEKFVFEYFSRGAVS